LRARARAPCAASAASPAPCLAAPPSSCPRPTDTRSAGCCCGRRSPAVTASASSGNRAAVAARPEAAAVSAARRGARRRLPGTRRTSIPSILLSPQPIPDRLTPPFPKFTFRSMPRGGRPPIEGDMLQGTLDVLVLKTLAMGPAHGHTIAHAIERRSEDVLQVEHGSLYPALHRLEDRGWIA